MSEIPKKIHYCWFGGKALPHAALRCIDSWKCHFPDFEIVRWDESNYDVRKIPYVREAYEAGKFAFVSDYARFDILYHEGGVYFDTDVEVVKSFAGILEKGAFFGREFTWNINPGLGIGAPAGLPVYRQLLQLYSDRKFLKPDGSCDLTTIVDITTAFFVERGFCSENREIQQIDGVYIYPRDYFCPQEDFFSPPVVVEETCSIHHYSASWVPQSEKFAAAIFALLYRISPKLLAFVQRMRISRLWKPASKE